MSDSQQEPWSNNPNAPKILYRTYFQEKVSFAGNFICSILYGTCKKSTPCPCSFDFVRLTLGIIIILFFKCMVALFNPDYRRSGPIKWGLVSYTVVMFSLVTVGTAMQLDVLSLSYIDNRQFPGVAGVLLPGPLGYPELISNNAIVVIQNAVFVLSNWLADGFLVSLFDILFTYLGG